MTGLRLTFVVGIFVGGCSAGASGPGGGAAAVTMGGVGGATGSSGGGQGGIAGSSGAAGATSGEGGGGGTAAGTTSGSGGGGGIVDAAIDVTADGQAGAGGGGAGGGDASSSPRDAASERSGDAPSLDAGRSNKLLIYAVTTDYRHASIPAACNAIAKAAAAVGLTNEQVGCSDATNSPDPSKFTAAALAQQGAVILLANSGEPFGYPATQEIQNLVDYVQRGGALVAIENASHCYDGSFNGHPASQPYVQLIGADFIGHPGDVTPASCTKVGTQASIVQLPAAFATTDEIYAFSGFRMDNQIVVRCMSSGDSTHEVRAVSWTRDEGLGRYFYTALGHLDASWTGPMDPTAPNSRLVENHVIPGLLWAMRR